MGWLKAALRALWLAGGLTAALAATTIAEPFEDDPGARAIRAGEAYFRGNYAEAAKGFRLDAEQGNSEAQFLLGTLYNFGQGVPRDYAQAAKWYRKATEQGNASAQMFLARLYAEGKGVSQSDVEAAKWYRKAAEQGEPWAQRYLGSFYYNGSGVRKDYAEAVRWWRRAAEQGLAEAQYILGSEYVGGEIVQQDYVQAHKWLNLAASRFPPSEKATRKKAIEFRDALALKMTPTQIAEAQRLARDWQPRSAQVDHRDDKIAYASPRKGVPLKMDHGVFVVPVQINGTMTLDFAIDSGASDVSVPADIFSTLKRTGSINESDFSGKQTYILADGSKAQAPTFVIRSIKVGDIVLENVRAIVAPSQGILLLGQSFFERFKSWSIDNARQELLLETR